MERIGERLRKRREELGFTIDDIARSTKFRPEMIKAMEDGRVRVFDADAYRKAFLRAYASKLGLDPAEIIREQKSEEERINEALSGIRVRPRSGRVVPRALVWIVAAAVIVAGAFVLYERVLKGRLAGGRGDRAIEDSGDMVVSGGTVGQEAGDASAGQPGQAEEPEDIGAGAEDATADGPLAAGESVREDESGPADEPATVGQPEPEVNESTAAGEPATVGQPEPEVNESAAADEPATVSQPEPEVNESAAADEPATVGQPEPEVNESAAADEPEAGALHAVGEGANSLEVSVSGWSTDVLLLSGDEVLETGMLSPGHRRTYFSDEPFFFSHITNKNAISLLYNGRPVRMPGGSGRMVTNFRIPPEEP